MSRMRNWWCSWLRTTGDDGHTRSPYSTSRPRRSTYGGQEIVRVAHRLTDDSAYGPITRSATKNSAQGTCLPQRSR